MRICVRHVTHYSYPSAVSTSHNEVRLCPLDDDRQRRIDFRLTTDPAASVFGYEMPGGPVHHFSVVQPHRHLTVTAESVVETVPGDPFADLPFDPAGWDVYSTSCRTHPEFLVPTRYATDEPDLADWAARARAASDGSPAGFLLEVMREVNRGLAYRPLSTHVHTALPDVLAERSGVCQDFAHLMLAVCRHARIPARYVSGYLLVVAGEPHLRGETASHAWVEAWLPDGTWRGFDPTNAILVTDHYVRVHTGLDYADCTPVRGVYRGPAATTMQVQVSVDAVL